MEEGKSHIPLYLRGILYSNLSTVQIWMESGVRENTWEYWRVCERYRKVQKCIGEYWKVQEISLEHRRGIREYRRVWQCEQQYRLNNTVSTIQSVQNSLINQDDKSEKLLSPVKTIRTNLYNYNRKEYNVCRVNFLKPPVHKTADFSVQVCTISVPFVFCSQVYWFIYNLPKVWHRTKWSSNGKMKYHALKMKRMGSFVKLGWRFYEIEWQYSFIN